MDNVEHYYNGNSYPAGGSTGSTTDEVLLYNSEEDEWTTVGHMSTPRAEHGMSLVPANIADFCS